MRLAEVLALIASAGGWIATLLLGSTAHQNNYSSHASDYFDRLWSFFYGTTNEPPPKRAMSRSVIIVCALALGLNSLPSPGKAAPIAAVLQLKGLNAADAQFVIGRLVEAQGTVRSGNKIYFELLSGAPAAYDATLVAPRQAFLSMRFEHPDVVERLDSPNSLWRPYRLTYFGKKGDELMWEVEVVLGAEDRVERVEMLYKPPPPF